MRGAAGLRPDGDIHRGAAGLRPDGDIHRRGEAESKDGEKSRAELRACKRPGRPPTCGGAAGARGQGQTVSAGRGGRGVSGDHIFSSW